jgi:uncharacterized protein (TIGR03067 family)
MDGKEAPEADRIKDTTVEITADKITFKDMLESKYKLDPSAKPKAIDIVHSIQGGGEETVRAIYKLDGDKLTICGKFHGGGGERPTEFESKEGSGIMLMILKREKK